MGTITTWNITTTPDSEYTLRRKRLFEKIAPYHADAAVIMGESSMRYLCGCLCMATERPLALILKTDGYAAMMVPRLEYEHVQTSARLIDEVREYGEYPGLVNPMYFLADMLKSMNVDAGVIVSDNPTYPPVYGSRSPLLQEVVPNAKVITDIFLVSDLKVIKSEFDIKCLRESSRWGGAALTNLVNLTHPGVREPDIIGIAAAKATEAMKTSLGPDFDTRQLGYGGMCRASAVYRGQFGPRSAMPHCNITNQPIPAGVMLVGEASGDLLDYHSELERTFFLGEPTQQLKDYYKMAKECAEESLAIIKPGITCAEVDEQTHRYYDKHDLNAYWRHHTGHSVGFAGHEWPFLDIGQKDVVLEPGMTFSMEPGFYVEGVGGFRLSDTFTVTETGIELLTYFPRELDKIIIE